MIIRFIKSLRWAVAGWRTFFGKERNGQIQLVVAFVVTGMGFLLNITRMEWIVIILCISVVLILEMLNTSIEKLCNLITTEFHPQIKIIKDVCAGAVLTAAMASFIVGLLIFIPYFLRLISE